MEPRHEILTTDSMAAADRFAIENGVSGGQLMERAGLGLAAEISKRWAPRRTLVLCGPGNNGGDGFVAARHLAEAGWPVTVMAFAPVAALSGDARWAAEQWAGQVEPLASAAVQRCELVVDALFGAGLSRPLEGEAAACAAAANAAHPSGGLVVAAADTPSGLHGDRAACEGAAFQADLTVTFHRFKPAHLLQPGRSVCGELALIDIGIPEGWASTARVNAQLNASEHWTLPVPGAGDHKHSRGRLAVLAGPAGKTGAARLSAEAGLIAGAGLVTLVCPGSSYLEAAVSSRAVMTRKLTSDGLGAALEDLRASAAILGPGAGVNPDLRASVLEALAFGAPLVLDADALTAFEDDPQVLFDQLHDQVVLTPHAGEFERLFAGFLASAMNKTEAAKTASDRSGAVIVLKGADTIIAAPGRLPRVNVEASPRLATAGSGDVLAGVIGALLAQGVSAFDAAFTGVGLHGRAGLLCGAGSTAQTLLERLPAALEHAQADCRRRIAMQRLMGE